jgi:hypothetical protein
MSCFYLCVESVADAKESEEQQKIVVGAHEILDN